MQYDGPDCLANIHMASFWNIQIQNQMISKLKSNMFFEYLMGRN